MEKLLFCLVGRHGAGKSTLATHLHALYGFRGIPYSLDFPTGSCDVTDNIIFSEAGTPFMAKAEDVENGTFIVCHPDAVVDLRQQISRVRVVYLDVSKKTAASRELMSGVLAPDIVRHQNEDDVVFENYLPNADYVIDAERLSPSEMAGKMVRIIHEEMANGIRSPKNHFRLSDQEIENVVTWATTHRQ